MKKTSLFIVIITSLFFFSFAFYNGGTDYWEILEKVKIKHKFNPETENFDRDIKFSNKLKKIDGQKIQLKGFVMPKRLYREKVLLSKFENSRFSFCCGGYDIYELVEIELVDSVEFQLDKAITLEGDLKLNADDPFKFMYVLENASCLDCE